MMALCAAHTQLKSVYGVSRVTCHHTPGPPIFMSKVRGPGVDANDLVDPRPQHRLFVIISGEIHVVLNWPLEDTVVLM